MTRHLLHPLVFVWLLTVTLIGLAVGVGNLLPVGSEIVYTDRSDRLSPKIILLDADRILRQRITDPNSRNTSPSWSPDGNFIVYNSLYKDSPGLFIMDATGHNKRPQNTEGFEVYGGYWSPDGQQILLSIVGGQFGLLNVSTGELTIGEGRLRESVWSPDSKNIINQKTVDDYFTGVNVRCITNQNCAFSNLVFLHDQNLWGMPVWSPDGRTIAFSQYHKSDLRIVVAWLRCPHLLTSCIERYDVVADTPFDDLEPVWSPDSQRIAFTSNRSKLSIVNIATHETYSFDILGTVNLRKSWSPDGKYITYMSYQQYTFNIYLLNIETGESRLLIPYWYDYDLLQWRPISH